MKIVLYNSKAEKNRVNKNGYLDQIVELEGTLRAGTSLVNPAVVLELHDEQLKKVMDSHIPVVDDDGNEVVDDESKPVTFSYVNKVLSANYAYIPDFNRWYFVTDITATGRNLWMITMSVDVLMSYYGDIMNLSAFIARNQFLYDTFVNDDLANFDYKKEIEIRQVSNKSDVTELRTDPPIEWNTAIMAYLTDDDVLNSMPTPALNDLSSIGSTVSGGNISTQYITGPTRFIYQLAKTVYKNDTLLSFVKTIMIYPFSIPSIVADDIKSIKIGTTDYTLPFTFKYPDYYPGRVVVADFDVPEAASFLDYSPYTTYEIYIPYSGFVTLSGENILGKNLKVFYLVNWEDGTANAYIYNVTDNVIIYSAQCVLGVKVALSSSNATELSNQKTALGLNTGINLIGSAMTIGGGIVAGNPLAVGAGILKGTSTIGNAISGFNQMYDIGKVGITSAVAGLSSGQKVFLRITKTKPVGYDTDYFALKGRPLNQYKKLSDLSGFTIVNDVHIENIPNATLTETNEIERLLTTGVIL
jgi:hypothetical protein